ncbi:TonB-dependent receptor [Niastella caeni]|uniref:TonB-dependent receptor n=2 Tax=Niastella caeni TaxID=2569763 RepID=A0A4S8HXR3_9BACT|nr:TonB-dependent receptor [Niastella caeni]
MHFYQEKETRITLQIKNEKLQVILGKIEKRSGYAFVYSNDEIDADQKLSIQVKEKELRDVLSELFTPLHIGYEIIKNKIILKGERTSVPLAAGSSGVTANRTVEAATARVKTDTLIEGRVVDENQHGLANINVQLKGASLGTTTNARGYFSLRIGDDQMNGVLHFSSIGYTPQEVPLGGKRPLLIQMKAESKDLGEVVVIGYGTQRKISVTGSVDNISKKAIEGRPVTNLSTALQGVSPNLIIQQRNFEPGQGVNINIRGLGTLGDNTPLVVIDGILGGDLNLINPNDIESVSILKDAGSAAIYGSRAANGVILITTKKGRKNAKPTVAYTGIYGIQTPRITYKPVHAWENAYYKNESLVNSGLSPAFTPEQLQEFKNRGDGDWRVDNIFHDAPQQTHNISVSGGGANNMYLLSVGYLDQQNNFIGPGYGYKRYNVRLNQTNEIGRLKLNTILSYVKVLGKDHSYNAGTLIVDASRVPLYYSYQDSAGNYLTNPVSAQFNPKAILEKGGYRKSNDDEVFGNLSAEYQVIKDLKVKGVFGGTFRSNHTFGRRMQLNFIPGGVYGDDREIFDNNYKSIFTNLQLIAEYSKTIHKHYVQMLAGVANESFRSEKNALYQTLTDPALGIPVTGTKIDAGRSFNSNGTDLSDLSRPPATIETSIHSLFGRGSYSWSDRYFAEVNFRYDGSSKFAKGNRWGFFPSVSAGWRISEEAFMDNLRSTINNLKVRGSYGILGNQNVRAYQYQTTFNSYPSAYGFNNSVVSGAGYNLGNPDLTWEKAATFNIGVDVTLLNRRLEFSYDWFDKTTSDILYGRKDVPQLFGAGFADYNVAKVKNRGWEVRASYNWPGKVISQTFSVNLADNLNELLALTYGTGEQKEPKEEFEIIRRVGQPITLYRGYKRNGYFQTLDDLNKAPRFANSVVTPGDIKYVDRNGDGLIDDKDKFILGNPFPRYTFGFTYTATAKGFDVQVFIQGVGKRDAMIRGEQVEPFHVGYGGTMYAHQTDYWTPSNPHAKYPRLAENGSASNKNNYRVGSDLYLFNAAYARLKNVQLGYTIPATISSRAHMQKVRVYLTGQNLVTLTKLTFLDPEITEFDNNTNLGAGANSARAYFLPIFYGFGLDVTF